MLKKAPVIVLLAALGLLINSARAQDCERACLEPGDGLWNTLKGKGSELQHVIFKR